MKKEDTRPKIIIIGRNDETHRWYKIVFRNAGLDLYDILQPEKTIDWAKVEPADIIIADLEETEYGFKDCEMLDTVRELYPQKIVIAETNNYNRKVSAQVKKLGANGYIFRNQTEDRTLAALFKMIKGKRFFMGVPRTIT